MFNLTDGESKAEEKILQTLILFINQIERNDESIEYHGHNLQEQCNHHMTGELADC